MKRSYRNVIHIVFMYFMTFLSVSLAGCLLPVLSLSLFFPCLCFSLSLFMFVLHCPSLISVSFYFLCYFLYHSLSALQLKCLQIFVTWFYIYSITIAVNDWYRKQQITHPLETFWNVSHKWKILSAGAGDL